MTEEVKTLHFTVDFPALVTELIRNNAENLGVGACWGLHLALMGLRKLGEIAIQSNDTVYLEILETLGIVSDEPVNS